MFTSYFAQVPNIEYPVSIARINPEWYDRAAYPKLAPSKELLYDFKYGIHRGDKDFYTDAAFTHYSDKPLDLKQVVNTNKCLVHIDAFDNKLLVTSCIDNLLKGAVGQAVQNMNLMFGIDETAGLKLKASAF